MRCYAHICIQVGVEGDTIDKENINGHVAINLYIEIPTYLSFLAWFTLLVNAEI